MNVNEGAGEAFDALQVFDTMDLCRLVLDLVAGTYGQDVIRVGLSVTAEGLFVIAFQVGEDHHFALDSERALGLAEAFDQGVIPILTGRATPDGPDLENPCGFVAGLIRKVEAEARLGNSATRQ